MKKRLISLCRSLTSERIEGTIRCLIPVAIYAVVYLTWFFHLEGTKALHYTEIHTALDDKIPFLKLSPILDGFCIARSSSFSF